MPTRRTLTEKIALWSLVVSSIGTAAVIWYAWIAQEQRNVMIGADQKTEEALRVARASLTLSRRVLETTQQLEGPEIIVLRADPLTPPLTPGIHSTRVYIRNVGRSAALAALAVGSIRKLPARMDELWTKVPADAARAMIEKGETQTVLVTSNPIRAEDIDLLAKGAASISIELSVEYKDIFGNEHHRPFCMAYRSDDGSWGSCRPFERGYSAN